MTTTMDLKPGMYVADAQFGHFRVEDYPFAQDCDEVVNMHSDLYVDKDYPGVYAQVAVSAGVGTFQMFVAPDRDWSVQPL